MRRAGGRDRARVRSAPLALALHHLSAGPALRLHVRIDERSAAFLALGLAKASRRPVVLACTSGTAAAHFHAAVIEADEAGVPLIVLTADRPPELRGTGANQAVDQLKLYGGAVRWFCEAGVPEARAGMAGYWRSLACVAWRRRPARWRPSGARAHQRAAAEPGYRPGRPCGWPEPLDGRPAGRHGPASATRVAASARLPGGRHGDRLDRARRGRLRAMGGGAGPLLELAALAAYWPVLAEPSSGAARPERAVRLPYLLETPIFTGGTGLT
jgi:2-succinyl-5-enolpyruvyl-6-hydroxy-3-cyclohexene-1-carboxylate synthase